MQVTVPSVRGKAGINRMEAVSERLLQSEGKSLVNFVVHTILT